MLRADVIGIRFHSKYENQNTVDSALNVPGQTSNPRQNSNAGLSRVTNQPDPSKFKLDMKFKIADMIYLGLLES